MFALSALLGVVNLFDNPARQTFVSEMVGRDLLPNAVSLNSVVMNSARVIGPAIGGVLILTLGVSTCFIVNAASYAAVIVALSLMRRAELYSKPGVARAKGQVREGLRYVWATADLRSPLLSMAIVGVFAFNFTVTLPLLAKFTFHGGAGLYSSFLAAMGAGAVLGGLFTAHRSNPSTRLLAVIGVIFGALITAVSLAPTKMVAIILLVPMGAASISFIATNNATLATASRSGHAGPGHVPQRRGLPGQHPDRRPVARVHQRCHQPAGGPGGGRRGDAAGQRSALLPGHPPARSPSASAPPTTWSPLPAAGRVPCRARRPAERAATQSRTTAMAERAGPSIATAAGPARSATTPSGTTGSVPSIPPR